MDTGLYGVAFAIAITFVVINRLIYGYKFIKYAKQLLKSIKEQDKQDEQKEKEEEDKEEKAEKEKPKWLFFALLGIGFPITLAILYFLIALGFTTIQFFRNQYLLPKELNNLNNLECYFESNFNLTTKEWEIVYFNDQYIFVELKTLNKSGKYQIVDFDILLDQNQCEEKNISTSEEESSTVSIKDSTSPIEVQTDSVVNTKIESSVSEK